MKRIRIATLIISFYLFIIYILLQTGGNMYNKKDKAEKYLENYPDVFADIYNVLLYGERRLKPENLIAGPTEAIYKAENGAMHEQRRDISKYYTTNNRIAVQYGIENQSSIDKDMPIRVMGYDSASYRAQIAEGNNRYPVKTIVLNFNDNEWNAPLSLNEITSTYGVNSDQDRNSPTPEGNIDNYGIQVFNIAHLPAEIIEQFTSDFRIIADFFARKNRGEYIPSQDEIMHIEAVLNMLRVFTSDERFGEIERALVERKKKGERITMCTLIDDYINQGKAIGIEEGIEQGFEQGIEQGIESGWQQIAEVVRLLKNGTSTETLLASEYPQELINIAITLV